MSQETSDRQVVGRRLDRLVGRISELIVRFEKATDAIARADNQRLMVMKELQTILEKLR